MVFFKRRPKPALSGPIKLKVMFGVFRQIAREEGYTDIWGFGGTPSEPEPTWRWRPDFGSAWRDAAGPGRPADDPGTELMGMTTRPEVLVARVRAIAYQKEDVAREMAEDIFGVTVAEGKGLNKLRKLYRKAMALIHPDRQDRKNPEVERLTVLLNQAFDFFKD